MKTCYNVKNNDFDISWPGRVSRHDLVFLSPINDPMQYGLPIGNGDVGALVWCDERRIYIAVNKCDLWDDADYDEFGSWEDHLEEKHTTLRHACKIVIDFKQPVFDSFYLKDYEARLKLENGCAVVKMESPLGSLSVELFVAYNENILCGRVNSDFVEPDEVEISLEHYGSRTYNHWYARVRRDPTIGLSGTNSEIYKNSLVVSHKLTTGIFYCVTSFNSKDFKLRKHTSHKALATAKKCPKEFEFFTVVTTPLDENSDRNSAVISVKNAQKKGFDALLKENSDCWHLFWDRSFIETDDDYLDNYWHLAMYYSCAGQRGRYPGRFINSLWNWNRDIQPWNFYYHWNQQEVYWGLNAAGHHDLCEPYLNYRFSGIECAKKFTMKHFETDGIFVSDVCDRLGRNSNLENDNHTPGIEIALDFWRQYRYTCDDKFLKEKALPYMLEVAKFFSTRFEKKDDGFYHAKDAYCYESHTLLYDPHTEITFAKIFFDAVIKGCEIVGVSDENLELYRDIKDNVIPLTYVEPDPRMLKDNGDGTYTVMLGAFKGTKVNSPKVISPGQFEGNHVAHFVPTGLPKYKDELLEGIEIAKNLTHEHETPTNTNNELTRFKEGAGHPQTTTMAAFPAGTISMSDRDTDEFKALITTALTSRDRVLMGWDTFPVVLARLGLSDEVDKILNLYPSEWQYYNNGFSHYGPNCVFVADMLTPFRHDLVMDCDSGEQYYSESFPFRHMGLEPLGVFSATMNERLLQSHDGIIRILPAYKKDTRFKLHAVGGFEVMCEAEKGKAKFVSILSKCGKNLKLENPWDKAFCNGVLYEDKIIEIETKENEVYLFTENENTEFETVREEISENKNYKVRPDKNATLGLPRCF